MLRYNILINIMHFFNQILKIDNYSRPKNLTPDTNHLKTNPYKNNNKRKKINK